MRVRKVVYERYSRYYDATQRKFYWHENKSGKTFWVVSNWLMRQNIPLPMEDQLIYDSHQKIEVLNIFKCTLYACVLLKVCMYICMYVCMYVCMYL